MTLGEHQQPIKESRYRANIPGGPLSNWFVGPGISEEYSTKIYRLASVQDIFREIYKVFISCNFSYAHGRPDKVPMVELQTIDDAVRFRFDARQIINQMHFADLQRIRTQGTQWAIWNL